MNVVLIKLVNLDLAGKTINGNVTMTSDATGTIDIKAGTITGDLTVDAKNATVNNNATVNGTITIKDVKSGTWNQLVDANNMVFEATGKTLKIANGVKVENLTLNAASAKVTIAETASFTNPVEIKKETTIITTKAVNAVIANDVTVTVKADATVPDEDAVNFTGTESTNPVELDPTKKEEVDESKAKVSNKEELENALTTEVVTEITIEGTMGSDGAYTVYNVDRAVTIKGGADAKVYGTFIVKADGVTIDNLAIQNKGDLKGESTTNRGGIYVFANDVTLTNNTITNGLGENDGLSNAIQIMSPTKGNLLSKYTIIGNNLIGHDNEVPNWSSSGIVIAQNYTPGSIGKEVKAITATAEDYQNLLKGNTFTNNKIDLTHQDWTKDLEGGPVLYVYPEQKTDE